MSGVGDPLDDTLFAARLSISVLPKQLYALRSLIYLLEARERMADLGYTGRFPRDAVQRVLESVKPIPAGLVDFSDDYFPKRRVPRAEAIVRRLETLDALTQINLQHQTDLSPSELAKAFHAIEAAAAELLKKLGVLPDADWHRMQRQIFEGLRWSAERQGERLKGFPNYPAKEWKSEKFSFVDYHGDSQLQDNVSGIAQIRRWAAEAEAKAKALIGRANNDPFMDLPEFETWDGDPLSDALDGILRIWKEVLGRKVATSTNLDGIASGPLIRFTESCFEILNLRHGRGGKRLGSEAIRARIRRKLEVDEAHLRKM